MKLTWFGGSTFRIHIGGQVVALDPHGAPAGIDHNELVSGADHIARLGGGQSVVDARNWRPRPAERLLDSVDTLRPVQLWAAGPSSLLIDGDDDTPLLLLGSEVPEMGRWSERAVVVLAGPDLAVRADRLVEAASPRLIALAGDEMEIDAALGAVRSKLDGTGLIALEPGMAVEV